MTGYVLTAAAESDLRSIVRYTRKQWGNAQVRHYIATLERGIASLADGEGAFKDMDALFPALRMGLYEHHYVSACRVRKRLLLSWLFSISAWI
ncbi:type II toxin-antitoxin system RelE/ParE family toxin [Methylophilus sp. 14]|uniref:type II toxin-antitoxin system RelE/ParE family toxin n=1 Tax=Methylophilus sp. 14 TaxID=2781019 RepID=UPI001E5A2FFC|nr:type II toxin-antitoxin system RelE/ParE family toxin [Methylophilus sp. 14]